MVRVAVVGGGLVGLATARHLLHLGDDDDATAATSSAHTPARQPLPPPPPRRRVRAVTVYEAAPHVAPAQSGNNSGVIHAGIYYAPGTLKARLCVQGARALYAYCATRPHVPVRRAGKFIVATDESELPRLTALYERARANGVPGVQLVDVPRAGGDLDASARAPPACVRGVRALHSPATGIISYRALAESFAHDIRADARGAVRTSHPVRADVASPRELGADLLVYCTGVRTRPLHDMRIVPFRGQYYEIAPRALQPPQRRRDAGDGSDSAQHSPMQTASTSSLRGLFDTNVYPVPDARFPFAGVHFTPTVDGRVLVGPTATLSQRDVFASAATAASTLLFPGFWRLTAPYAAFGAREFLKEHSSAYLVRALQRYVPSLRASDVRRTFAGVRAQAVHRSGRLVDDFVFRRGDGDDAHSRVLHVCNAPSPAATSCMAIAEYVVREQLLPMMATVES